MRTVSSLTLILLAFFLLLGSARVSSAQVTVNTTAPSSSSVPTSFTLQANASSPNGVTGWYVYIDNYPVWNTPGPASFISAPLSMSAGTHNVTVRAWDRTGAFGDRSLTVNASAVSPTGVSVSVQSPSNGASVSSPVTFNASASSPNGISGWVIYMDNQNVHQVNNSSNSLSASVNLPGGTHTIYIRAWDKVSGYGTSPSFSINVGGSSGGSVGGALPTPPASARTWTNLDQTTDKWSDCSDCAGGALTGNYWKAFWQTSPSMDGASLQFFNGGGPWADVLWVKKLGNQSWASNFIWDFYVYFDATTAANLWSAEYDLWQSVGGWEFMIGTQCVFGTGEWDTWDQAAGRWVKTSVPCKRMSAGNWHHIQMYLQRVSGNRYKYVTLVVDGQAYTLNQTFNAGWSGWGDDFGVQWQLDLNGNGTDAHEWVDKVQVSIW